MACVLIIDDDPSVRSALRKALESMGHLVFDASDGWKGLVIADEHQPDVALVDIIMPEMDGLEVIRKFKEKHYQFPIIAMPAQAATQRPWYGDIAKLFGADDLLEKPFTSEEIESVVNRLIKQNT